MKKQRYKINKDFDYSKIDYPTNNSTTFRVYYSKLSKAETTSRSNQERAGKLALTAGSCSIYYMDSYRNR